MSKFVNILPKLTLWILMPISVVATALVLFGGSVDPSAEYLEPVYTDVLLYWMVVSLALALVVTLGIALVQLIKGLIKRPGAVLKSLISPLLLVGVLLIGYFGMNDVYYMSAETMPTFDGTITLGMNQLTNMCLLGAFVLLGVAILMIIFSGVFKPKVKNN